MAVLVDADVHEIAERIKAIMTQDEQICGQIEMARRAAELLQLDDEMFQMTLESETDTVEHCEMLAAAAMLAFADAMKNKVLAEHYTRGKRDCEHREDKIRQRIARIILRTNRTSLQTPTANLSIRQTESVAVDDEVLIPEQYVKFEIVPKKDLIKLDLKAGIPVPGCRLTEKTSLTIKAK